ncbi:Nitroreductase family protein [Fructilactobacillus florum 8D]|uniref:Nitroreductase family protein n=2 Tax=Fructilactobacillus florum TaxID=640331 RepID=W9EG30_9LACO|nr:nitroreductase family protein [Fructilactobacillus florum]EKK20493.1 Nitroreductase family protein [Fructilactobacillus florum 2F]ETO41017.1 Nitroreductase family protein [Fructilactobacillus florum 8D]KRM92291.1 hypothetical protein FC87_GL000422 [Fructilactobacillus florum DSM 22689 = JCM 16035]
METSFLQLIKQRRTVYALGKQINFSEAEIYDYIKDVIRAVPSAFNSQPVRVAVLFNQSHQDLWEIVATALAAKIPADSFLRTKAKISTFQKAFGTILFFTDLDVVQKLVKTPKLATYQYQEYNWSEEAQGNAQFAVWTGLEANGLGVNLQHYDPLITATVKQRFAIPEHWQLRGEMVFGSIEQPGKIKPMIADDARFKLFK